MLPDETAPNGHRIELAGELAGILALGDTKTTKPATCANLGSLKLVAGARFDKYLPLYKTYKSQPIHTLRRND
jgi:hypothetical protein